MSSILLHYSEKGNCEKNFFCGYLPNRQTSCESASLPKYLGCNTVFAHGMRLRVTFLRRKTVSLQSNIAHRKLRSKMATIDEFALKNIEYIIIGRIFESEIILISPSLKISESSSNGSYRQSANLGWVNPNNPNPNNPVVILLSR